MEKNIMREDVIEKLLSEMDYYTLDKENTKSALKYLKEMLKGISSKSEEYGITVAYRNYRLKELNSFLNKILKNINSENSLTYNEMHDIAAARLTVLTLSDVYRVKELIESREDIKVIQEKDYIMNPKDSGYRSLHMIIEVPVETEYGVKYVKSEIQLRTILEDIYATLEWIIRYKGNYSKDNENANKDVYEASKKLNDLSGFLSINDFFLDISLRDIKNTKKEVSDVQLAQFRTAFEKLSGGYENKLDYFDATLTNIIGGFDNRYNILHKESRIKPVESIVRKANEKGLSCTSDDIKYRINDVIGFKLVCIDLDAARSLVDIVKEGIEKTEFFSVVKTCDHFDKAKPGGYRGYKISVEYNNPLEGKPIRFEILIRTLFMDAWAEWHNIVFKNPEAKNKYFKVFSDLSEEFYKKEAELTEIRKKLSEEEDTKIDLVNALYNYKNNVNNNQKPNTKAIKLSFENKPEIKKNEEE